MHRSVELELEEVDCIQDQQLLQKANVSPFFTSARPPYAMLSELDFSPQAISRAADDIAGASKTTNFHSIQPLSLDCSSFSTCPSYSNASQPTGGYEMKPLSRVPSWQELSFAGQDQSPGRLCGNSALAEESGGGPRNDSLLSPVYEYHRSETLGCLPSLYDDEYSGRERGCGNEKSEMFEHHDAHISPFKDDLNVPEPAAPSKRVIVTDNDLRLFAPNRSVNTRSHNEFWENSYLAPSAPVFRSLETPRFRREKMFPQQNDNGFFVPKSSSSACSTKLQVIPFPIESLSLATSKPKRHHAFKKQSPLPDAQRTSKTKRASKDSPFCKLPKKSPMTELTKKFSRDSEFVESFSERSQICRLPGLQQSYMPTSGLAEFGASSSSQMWHRERHTQFSPQQQPGYYGLFSGFAMPTLQSPRILHKRKIGAYSPEARQERIKRFHQKRKERVFHKRIKYDCRKRLANACPRIKGRFVKKQDFDESVAQASAQTGPKQAPLSAA
ncbi:Two-component response regulator aprr1 [Globisporangium polare]